MMHPSLPRKAALTVGAALALTLSGCAGMPSNRSMYSVHEPVVERTDMTLDLASSESGLPYTEQQRLGDWFEAIGVRYGDRITIEDPLDSPATRVAVQSVATRFSLIVGDASPAATGAVQPGTTRVIVTRSKAVVRGCPDWQQHSDANFVNGLSHNYGCAVNSNLAAMVANPEHLLKGDEASGDTVIMSSNKAISTYRSTAPTGAGGLKATSSKGD